MGSNKTVPSLGMNRPAMTLGFAVAILCVLVVVFVFLPDGWNVIPLFLITLLLTFLLARIKSLRKQLAVAESDRRIDAEKNQDDAPDGSELAGRVNRSFGPIAAGLVIDLVDFATFGPIGLVLGLPVGGLAGYWMARALGLDQRASLWCALASGVYCTLPGTELIPLATIIGACVRFRETDRGTKKKRRKKR